MPTTIRKWDYMRETTKNFPGMPPKQGLYDPLNEHDACGIGFVANIKNRKSHEIVKQGLQVLDNVTHRGAAGADPLAGDGAGILIQIPDTFLRAEAKAQGIDLPAVGDYGVAMVFFPNDDAQYDTCEKIFIDNVKAEGQKFLGWRDVPVNSSVLGESVKPMEPRIRQGFIAKGENCADTNAFELKLFVIRKQIQRGVRETPDLDFFIPSMSARTLCYKGMILAGRVADYYLDLQNETLDSALALVHQRFSTNTFPSWELAQPFRYLCHNGEINTVRGNINWMAARRSSMKSEILGDDLDKLWPLLIEGRSDSATFDNALELLVSGGYSLAHAMMLMIPEAWSNNPLMDDKRRAFYEYNAALMEPWDGPAAVAFTDGRQIGATLDRNGLRPARYVVTEDDLVVMGSEVGVIAIPEEKIVQKWRLQPGKMFLIDLEQGRIIDDEELKADLANANPYQDWLDKTQIMLEDLPAKSAPLPPNDKTLLNRQQAFGYTQEDQKFFLEPMAVTGQDPVGAMGRDTPPAVLSDRPKMLSDYFKQCFAQVTNPPIDPIREELVMSLVSLIGPRPNLLDLKSGGTHNRMEVRQPILTNIDLEKIRHFEFNVGKAFRTYTLDICYPAEDGADGMAAAVEGICKRAEEVVRDRYNILVLSDRGMDESRIAIPALLATGAVHHHLIREGLRTNAGLVVETGEARLVHDFCLLAGYGAEAVNPYLAFDVLTSLLDDMPDELDAKEVHKRYIKAIDKGMLKVMSKMGISTYHSYCGAQIFDAVGLNSAFIEKYFEGTASAIEGIGLAEVAEETVRRHQLAYGDAPVYQSHLDVGGDMAYRLRGELHNWTPETVSLLQHAVRGAGQEKYDEYSRHMNEQTKQLKTLRGLMDFKFDKTDEIPLDEVEPAKEIVKRFATGAMSFGSISFEAHTTLAIAMNRIGGKSNTGEGGELPERFTPLPNGDSMRSAIKQVASGRFGVTAEYLVNADELQIKMAQGAKPGEGGQLPGHKVDQTIAQVRYSTPGVGLISPPPHHDIYSIEDLAQLIHDLKNANRNARVSVKLVSTVGVGTIAAGVSKAHADHVLISGYDGGTGASPLTSVMHAGSPWEIGLAETQQTLVLNKLRSRIAVQVDGGVRTGRDVAIGALLGADEFGFATSALIATGCIMMRKCHLNTCPVGIATQDPELRKRFKGEPEHVVNFLFFVAEELRTIMAKLGFRSMKEMTGRSDLLDMRTAIGHWKAKGLDYTKLLHKPDMGPDVPIYHCEGQDHGLDKALDNMLIEKAQPAIENGTPVQIETSVLNINRTVGTMLSSEIAKKYGNAGLPDDTIYIKTSGSAGQSFGAFLAHGVTIEHVGDANDYTGKGLSGGRLMIYPAENVQFKPEENIIIGNVVLYGATGGEAYFRGVAGERFGVRNSGATAVVEGVGDHGCEYMTGGIVVVLGQSGRNFAAGMSGGIAYVLDEEGDFEQRCNLSMVELEPIPNEDLHHDQGRHQKGDLEGHGLVDIMHDMTRYDSMRLHTLIENHKKYTNSSRAQEILDNWDAYLPKFVKVMPVDYRRALMKMAEKARMRGQPCAAVAVGD
jgi:glutamate synthase (NADPH) large chain